VTNDHEILALLKMPVHSVQGQSMLYSIQVPRPIRVVHAASVLQFHTMAMILIKLILYLLDLLLVPAVYSHVLGNYEHSTDS
jgi:hypothetical protein